MEECFSGIEVFSGRIVIFFFWKGPARTWGFEGWELERDLHAATKEISTLLYKDLDTLRARRRWDVQPHLKKSDSVATLAH